jgi:demethylmenaquinone methyltransferase/2-methoxy-6-polyprenyl-1,4-benzoquinol methylase
LNVDRYWRWRTVRAVSPVGSAPILDLCTGTGDLALAYCRACRVRTPIVAADFCREMLTVGEQKKRRAGWGDELTFVEADAQHLPFADGYFQIVSVAFGLRNIQDTDRGLREMARVLAPGGRMAILEFSMPTRQPIRALYGWYFRYVLPRIGRVLARNSRQAYNYLPQSVGAFPAGEDLAARIRAAGMRDVRFQPLTFGVATLYVGVK